MNNASDRFMPTMADGTLQTERFSTQAIPKSQDSVSGRESGPLKQMIAHQDSLYRYLSWEDPARTLGSYVAALGFLLAVHSLHITQWALKAMAIVLGGMSVMEFAARSFGPDNFLARLRPREYRTVPESTLNATLKDIHDFIQFAVVQAQRIFFAQDLNKTFAAFVAMTALYFLIKVVPPFGIAILSLTTAYIIPLVTSPRGRDIAEGGVARAQELSNAAVNKGSALAQDSKAKIADLTGRAQDTTEDLRQRVGNSGQSGMQTTTSQSGHNVPDFSDTTNESMRRMPEARSNITNQVPPNLGSTMDDGNYSLHNTSNMPSDGGRFIPRTTVGREPQSLNDRVDIPSGRMNADDLLDVTNSRRNDVPSLSSGTI